MTTNARRLTILLLLLWSLSSHAQDDVPVARLYHRLADSRLFNLGYPASAYCDCAARAMIGAMQTDDIPAVMRGEAYSKALSASWTKALQYCVGLWSRR